jgi:hypothetical protein
MPILQIGLTLHMIGNLNLKAVFLFGLIALFFACGDSNIEKADNALDGGRYFLEHCNQGDFNKAKNYLLDNPDNQKYFKAISTKYFALDKEGRQELRQASLQINELQALDSNQTVIHYQSSLDKIPHQIKVINTPTGWKVDLKYTYSIK